MNLRASMSVMVLRKFGHGKGRGSEEKKVHQVQFPRLAFCLTYARISVLNFSGFSR
jgi:hypothetical protein